MEEQILDQQQSANETANRKELLPIWIKVFSWIFLVLGAFVPVAVVFGILGYSFSLSIYGLETISPFSLDGLMIMALMSFKAFVALGLITKKDWAVNLALIDGAVGILFCGFMMLVYPFLLNNGLSFNIRLELVALIPYFIKMKSIRKKWQEA
ncbi:hypothetical protein [Halocola ammonii]